MTDQTYTTTATQTEPAKTGLTLKEFAKSEAIITSFADILGEPGAKRYISSVLIAVASNEDLSACSPSSIMGAAMRAATLSLSVDPGVGQAYLVPFKNRATLIIGYKGLKDLAIRSGKYKYLHVSRIYEGENLVEDRMTGIHTLDLTVMRSTNTVVGYLLYFELFNGYKKTFFMTIEEINEHAARYSKSYGQAGGIWKTNFEAMCKKTVMRLGLLQYGVFEPHIAATLVQVDETQDEAVVGDDDVIEAQYKQASLTPPEPDEEPRMTEQEILDNLGFAH